MKKSFLIPEFGYLCLIAACLSRSSSLSRCLLFTQKELRWGWGKRGAGRRLKGWSRNADDIDLGSGQNPALLAL